MVVSSSACRDIYINKPLTLSMYEHVYTRLIIGMHVDYGRAYTFTELGTRSAVNVFTQRKVLRLVTNSKNICLK